MKYIIFIYLFCNTISVFSQWTQQTSTTSETLLGVSFVDSNNGWVVGTNGKILKTTTGGQPWVAQTSGTSKFLRDVCFSSASNGIIIGESGLILRTISWQSQSVSFSGDLYGVHFPAGSGKAWTVGQQGRIYHNAALTGVKSPHIYQIINALTVQPNPITDIFQVSFEITTAVEISFNIINSKGQCIQTKPMLSYPPGAYQITLESGSWPSGSYLLNAVAREGGIIESKKLVKVK